MAVSDEGLLVSLVDFRTNDTQAHHEHHQTLPHRGVLNGVEWDEEWVGESRECAFKDEDVPHGEANNVEGMSPYIEAQADARNTPNNTKKFAISWMLLYLLVVSFDGLFSIVALRKMMKMKYKLTYPSGNAIAYLINCFHTPKGAKKQVGSLFKSFSFSFIFGGVQWIYAREDGCGFGSLRLFGSQTYAKRAIMWPMIEAKKGDWYSTLLSVTSLHGIQGYRVFIAIVMMLGDGLFHFAYMLVMVVLSVTKRKSDSGEESSLDNDTKIRNNYF
ncbi:hypothetical protein RND71_009549 [Anisodus tanguticus]|uniref:Uncharacterized protein n=1 Tax=Anisodus tanguticus TaxID=243964 RepID=A0AAE1VRB3_9SOLA|nr:hypothetical protein RND71_009549 [Anisodus tanguticus]